MKQIYENAVNILKMRQKNCAMYIQSVSEGYDIAFYQLELAKVTYQIKKIEKRIKTIQRPNVIYVDFQSKKRVA